MRWGPWMPSRPLAPHRPQQPKTCSTVAFDQPSWYQPPMPGDDSFAHSLRHSHLDAVVAAHAIVRTLTSLAVHAPLTIHPRRGESVGGWSSDRITESARGYL